MTLMRFKSFVEDSKLKEFYERRARLLKAALTVKVKLHIAENP